MNAIESLSTKYFSESWPGRQQRAAELRDVRPDVSCQELRDRVAESLAELEAVARRAGSPFAVFHARRAADALVGDSPVNRERLYVHLQNVAAAIASCDPLRYVIPQPQPARPAHYWGTPFASPPDPAETQKRRQIDAERSARLEAGRRLSRAKDHYQHFSQRGVVLEPGDDGAILARPASLLSDEERRLIAEFKAELLAIITEAAVL